MSSIQSQFVVVTVKRSGGQPSVVLPDLDPNTTTVKRIKELISEGCGVQVDDQKLIYCGRILKDDEKTLASYSVKSSVSVHMVQKKTAVAPVETKTENSTPSGTTGDNSPAATSTSASSGSGSGSAGGASGSGNANPQAAERTRQLMEQLRANPQLLRQIIMHHPELMDNDDIRALSQDPDNVTPEAMERFQQMVTRLLSSQGPQGAPQPGISPQLFAEMMKRVMTKLGISSDASSVSNSATDRPTGTVSGESASNDTVAMEVDPAGDAVAAVNEDEYKEEVAQLEAMGFSNKAMSLMALRSVGGSVQEALEILLAQM